MLVAEIVAASLMLGLGAVSAADSTFARAALLAFYRRQRRRAHMLAVARVRAR